jgi:UDP:flavonoid glycosyltransferase YjiC (YdhE family)
MKIGIQTWGSHGDIRPLIALAEGLQAAGNEVHLVITCVDSSLYHGLVSKPGLRISVIGSPVLDPVQEEEIGHLAYGIRNPMKQMAAILRLCFAPVEDLMFDAAQQLCAESELVIGHYFLHPLQVAAEKAGKPHVSVLLSHAGIPPVYMTFGSWMPKDNPGQTRALHLMTEAARRAGCRAIIQSDSAQACCFVSDRAGAAPQRERGGTRQAHQAGARIARDDGAGAGAGRWDAGRERCAAGGDGDHAAVRRRARPGRGAKAPQRSPCEGLTDKFILHTELAKPCRHDV